MASPGTTVLATLAAGVAMLLALFLGFWGLVFLINSWESDARSLLAPFGVVMLAASLGSAWLARFLWTLRTASSGD